MPNPSPAPPKNPALSEALRDGWAAYGHGDLAKAHHHAARAAQIAPDDPLVRALFQRLAPDPGLPLISRARLLLFALVFESVLIGATIQMIGRLREYGIEATIDVHDKGSALHAAIEWGVMALVFPFIAWLVAPSCR